MRVLVLSAILSILAACGARGDVQPVSPVRMFEPTSPPTQPVAVLRTEPAVFLTAYNGRPLDNLTAIEALPGKHVVSVRYSDIHSNGRVTTVRRLAGDSVAIPWVALPDRTYLVKARFAMHRRATVTFWIVDKGRIAGEDKR